MKVTRVTATNRVHDRLSNSDTPSQRKEGFVIEAALMRDGTPGAEEDRHHQQSDEACGLGESGDEICYRMAKPQDFIQQGKQHIPQSLANDWLEDFLRRIRNAHRLDLRL
jgi:hypothetical protein